jgi:hypothetical protein
MPKSAYDEFKEFEGKRYTGMKVGRHHKWQYDQGAWKEKKVTPDKWEFQYAVVKRRAGKAPEGSGVPVGTAYNWYILAHQVVTKIDANSYTTEMVGVKHKLAHKRADKDTWSASDAAQRRRLVKILQELIVELEKPPEEITAPEAQPEKEKKVAPAVETGPETIEIAPRVALAADAKTAPKPRVRRPRAAAAKPAARTRRKSA